MRHILRAMLIAAAVAFGTYATPVLTPSAVAATKLIDINTATKAELEAIKGIGPVYADAIIKGRPYKAKDELHEKKIIPKSLYDKIKDQIIAKRVN